MGNFVGSFFSFKGRINRMGYLTRVVALIVIQVVVTLAFAPVLEEGGTFTFLGLLLGIGVSHISLIVRRLQDLSRSPWQILLLCIPLFNIYMYLVLYFKKGENGGNIYGPDPLLG